MSTSEGSDSQLTSRTTARRGVWIVTAVAVVALVAVGIASATRDDFDDTEAVTAGGQDPVPAVADSSPGTVRVQLEPVDGFFIEGFEVGLRFETADGEVIASTLWTDHVASLDDDRFEAYYDSRLDQPVPAGPVVVRAEVNIGIGPPPSIPDLEGDLPCRLDVEVGPDETVTVEVSFGGGSDCLRILPDPGNPSTDPDTDRSTITGPSTASGPDAPATPDITSTSVAVEPVVPAAPDSPAVGSSHYVDVDLECEAFTLGGTWVLVDGDPSTWQAPGERHEGGTFTIEAPGFGRFVGDAAETKVATFRLMGPNEGVLACMPIPRPRPPS